MIRNVSIVFPNEAMTTGCEVEELGKDLYILRDHPGVFQASWHYFTFSNPPLSCSYFPAYQGSALPRQQVYNF